MAHIGMKYPVAGSKKTSGEGYEKGFVIGKAISFTGTPNKNDVKLYADDGVAETDLSIQDLGVSLNVDDIDLATQAKLLGHAYTEATEEDPELMEIGVDDVAPKFGVGFYKRRRKNNITSFTAIFLYSVQFSEPTESANTKGQSTEFQTPTIEGTAFAVPTTDGVKNSVGKKAVFTDEAKAKAWLDTMAGVNPAG